jgi:hypothetical protein
MERAKGTQDEDIGRPGPWTEGRYQSPDQPIDQSVQPPPGPPADSKAPVSKPVTWRDYRFPSEQAGKDPGADGPGGDAG